VKYHIYVTIHVTTEIVLTHYPLLHLDTVKSCPSCTHPIDSQPNFVQLLFWKNVFQKQFICLNRVDQIVDQWLTLVIQYLLENLLNQKQ